MNTPPRSQLPTLSFSSASYTHAPKRPHFQLTISPPRFRAFEELEDSDCVDFEIERERIRNLQKEKEVKDEIVRYVELITEEDWLMRGAPGFSGIYSNL